MSRRMQSVAFLAGLLALAGALIAAFVIQGGDDSGDPQAKVVLAAVEPSTGRLVPPSFVGVSFEYFDMHSLVGIPLSGPNRAVAGLLGGLEAGGGPASVRAGGGSADATW